MTHATCRLSRELCVVENICATGEAFNSCASPLPDAFTSTNGISVVLACCVIRDRPRASKKSLRVPRTIQAESAARPLTARRTFRGRCSRATSNRKPRKYISTSRSLDVEGIERSSLEKFLLLILFNLDDATKAKLSREKPWRKDESSSISSSTITTSFVPLPGEEERRKQR